MFATFILVLFYRYDRVIASLWIRYPEYSWVKATIGICMLADYSVAKKHQQYPYADPLLMRGAIEVEGLARCGEERRSGL
jgi:hypothetical protein